VLLYSHLFPGQLFLRRTLVLQQFYSASYFTQRTQRIEEPSVLFSLWTPREMADQTTERWRVRPFASLWVNCDAIVE